MKLYLKYSLIFLLFLIPSISEAFTCTAVAGGGNWNAAGTWTGSCNSTFPQAGDDVVFDATSGSVAVNANTNNLKSLTMTGYTGTLSGSNSINVIGTTASTNNVIFDGLITWTGTLNINPTTATADINLTTNGKLLTLVSLGGSAADVVLQDNLSFTAAKTDTLTIAAAILNMNGFTVSGNSATNRLLVTSNTLGTQRTITRSSGAFAYADFRDIDLEAAYDCSGITGLCGNALGNSADFTFTTATTTYWIGGTGNWSDTAEWSWGSGLAGSTTRVPLPQDNVVFDNNSFSGASQVVTLDMPRAGTNIDWSAYSEAHSPAPSWTKSTASTIYGSLTLKSGLGNSGTTNITFEGRGSHTFASAGQTWTNPTFINMFGGDMTLMDSLTFSGTILRVDIGTLDADIYSVTGPSIGILSNASAILNGGTGTFTVTGTSLPWNVATNGVFNSESSTIIVSNTTATAKSFIGSDLPYNNVVFAGDNITVTGSNAFTNFAINNAGLPNGLLLTSGTTQTVTGSFTSNSSLGRVAILAATPSGNATITRSSGMFCGEYLNIASSTVTGGATWYAANSTDVGNNNGWTFSQCPAPNTVSRASTGSANEEVRGGLKIRGGAKFR